MTRGGWPTRAFWLALCAAVAVAYAPALRGELQFDDLKLLERPELADLGSYLTLDPWRSAFASGRPLTDLTFTLNHALTGFAPGPLHATGIALHLAATALAFLLARATLRRAGAERPGPTALAAAALFALHPLQSQAVAYVSQRAEVLSAALGLAALLLLLRSDDLPARRTRLRVGAGFAFALALAAKQSIAALPAAWLLHVAFFAPPGEERDPPLRRVARRLPAALPLAALVLVCAAGGVSAVHGSDHAGFGMAWLGAGDYALTQLRVVPTYLALFAWPAGLHVDWDVAPSRGLLDPPATLAGALLLLALCAGALFAERRTRGAAGHGPGARALRLAGFGALWFLLAVAPTSSVMPLADVLEEHRAYLALLGPCLAVAAAVVPRLEAATGRAREAAIAAVLVVAVALTAATHLRSRAWASELALWADAAEKSPRRARVRVNLGTALERAGRKEEAVREYATALPLASDYSISPALLVLDLSGLLGELGRLDEAAEALERFDREGVAGREREPRGHRWVLYNLALIRLDQGRVEDAAATATRLLAEAPDFPSAHLAAGLVAQRVGDHARAREAFAAAVALAPRDPVALCNLADEEDRAHRRDAACALLGRAALADPRGRVGATARARFDALRCSLLGLAR